MAERPNTAPPATIERFDASGCSSDQHRKIVPIMPKSDNDSANDGAEGVPSSEKSSIRTYTN